MGSSQLLLISLVLFAVGTASAVGIVMFNDGAISANRDALVSDLTDFASRAQNYYRRPRVFGGGEFSFNGCSINNITNKPSNDNGTYAVASAAGNEMEITATGIEAGSDGNPLSITMHVYPDSCRVVLNN